MTPVLPGTPSLLPTPPPPAAGSCYWTTERDGEVKLRLGKNSEDEPPTTVPDLIMSAATKYSHCLAIGSKYKKSWQLLTYIEYYEACRRAAKAFLKVPRLRLRNRDALPARVRAHERAWGTGRDRVT